MIFSKLQLSAKKWHQNLILSTRLGPEVNSPWAGPVQISVEHEPEVDEERREEKGIQEVSVG